MSAALSGVRSRSRAAIMERDRRLLRQRTDGYARAPGKGSPTPKEAAWMKKLVALEDAGETDFRADRVGCAQYLHVIDAAMQMHWNRPARLVIVTVMAACSFHASIIWRAVVSSPGAAPVSAPTDCRNPRRIPPVMPIKS